MGLREMSWRLDLRRWWQWWSKEEPRSSAMEFQRTEEWVHCFLLIYVCCFFLLCWFVFFFVISTSFFLGNISVRIYVAHLLRTYVILLCNWLILWQNALYLYLGRSMICLILEETCCSSLALKPWRLDQETSEEKLFIKAGQIARHLQTDSSIAAR